MLDVKVLNMNGEEVGTLSLSEAVFGIEPNTVAMHAAVVNYLANRRHGTQSTKTRTEVRGGGRNGMVSALDGLPPISNLSPFLFRQPFGLPPSPESLPSVAGEGLWLRQPLFLIPNPYSLIPERQLDKSEFT